MALGPFASRRHASMPGPFGLPSSSTVPDSEIRSSSHLTVSSSSPSGTVITCSQSTSGTGSLGVFAVTLTCPAGTWRNTALPPSAETVVVSRGVSLSAGSKLTRTSWDSPPTSTLTVQPRESGRSPTSTTGESELGSTGTLSLA